MKNLSILILTLLSILLPAQCQIIGSTTLKVGDSLQLMADTAAKCADCYSWKILSQDFLSVQSSAEGKISLKALKAGNEKITLTIETSAGKLSCEKDIEIKNISQIKEKKCDVEITDFKDVKVDENTMSFFPNVSSQKYSYRWKAFYADGTSKESEEKIPQFKNSQANVIDSIEVQIINKSSLCSSIITRTFGEKIWFPKVEKIEQRKYIQESFHQSQIKK